MIHATLTIKVTYDDAQLYTNDGQPIDMSEAVRNALLNAAEQLRSGDDLAPGETGLCIEDCKVEVKVTG